MTTAADQPRRAHRAHVLSDCFACGRNLWCPVEVALFAAAEQARRAATR